MVPSLRILLLTVALVAVPIQSAIATDYHVDSVTGDDTAGDGSAESPWQSLSRLDAVVLVPGDRILLKRGSVFRERLAISASCAAGNPIVVDAYDSGDAPVISAGSPIPQGAAWSGPDAAGEYTLPLGASTVFYTSVAVLVRAQPTGIDTYVLLGRGTPGSLSEDTYALTNVAGQRTVVYRPPLGTHPGDYAFEVSKRNVAVFITGDWVTVRNIQGLLGNIGNLTYDPPLSDATVLSTGGYTAFENCRAAFGRAVGIAVAGPESTIDGCLGEHNHSTGLYILGVGATGSVAQNSVSRYNGNLEFQDLDRGGIGVQADYAVIRNNVVHDNGNLLDTIGPRIAGDDAISLYDCHDVLAMNNFVYNSARGAIRMSYTASSYGHAIVGNVIANWNLAEQPGTISTQAISVFAFGNAAQSGNFEILNNTIYSDQVGTTLIGIQLGLPTTGYFMRDTSVLNNIVYLPHTTASDSYGIRLTREDQFDNVSIDHNDILLTQTGNNYSAFAGEFSTSADFNAALGYEASGLNTDPLFVFAPIDPEDPLSFDLALSSPLIDAGASVAITSDFIGRAVPSGLAPDIGAFEPSVLAPDPDGDGSLSALNFAWWNGNSWDIQTLRNGLVGYGVDVDLAFNPVSDSPAIAHWGGPDGNRGELVSWNGSDWDIELYDDVQYSGINPSLAFDGSGTPMIAFIRGYEVPLFAYRDEVDGWLIEVIDPITVLGDMSLALDPTGVPTVAYGDWDNDDQKFAVRQP